MLKTKVRRAFLQELQRTNMKMVSFLMRTFSGYRQWTPVQPGEISRIMTYHCLKVHFEHVLLTHLHSKVMKVFSRTGCLNLYNWVRFMKENPLWLNCHTNISWHSKWIQCFKKAINYTIYKNACRTSEKNMRNSISFWRNAISRDNDRQIALRDN